ncbi:rho GTPase-activating protein 6-like isoform X1 [Haliotis rufescens]|uniref:rho GTPase-activating protein 6-like isoform X1 n=1 Tax=Haliotis rufescens TaxID=6454 RepID=UPI00201EB810|nr:rho GTPase-activating protein 6-like isoform X1 [Haliotis rufescens]
MLTQTRPPMVSRHQSVENDTSVETLQRKKTNALRKVAETFGLARAPKGVETDCGEEGNVRRKRSRSLPDLQADGTENVSCYSDDEDGDDFGFRNSPYSSAASNCSPSPSTASPGMLKAKSPSPGRRKILPKRWRSKTKPVPNVTASSLWSPEGSCTWCSVSGRKVVLKPVSLLQLTDAERDALQKIAVPKLQSVDIGPLAVPKGDSDDNRRSKKVLSMKRRSKSANLAGLLDTLAEKEKQKDSNPKDGLVFGIPLSKCIAHDREVHKRQSSRPSTSLKVRSESADVLLSPHGQRKSSSSSQSSLDNVPHNGSTISHNPSHGRRGSSDSLSESESSRNTSSSLIDALSLSLTQPAMLLSELRGDNQSCYATGAPQVPLIVNSCFKHIETYGLQVLGIFRVGSSKKRVKQLQEEFDTGKSITLNESHNPHDVGALLKEYFRDLPEPLLTRDLYTPFISTRKLKDVEKRLSALRLLVSLLPLPNRDTFWALLKFLAKVVEHSKDTIDEHGNELSGNKMDAHNLATLFGPNILHKAKSSPDKEFRVETTEHAEQSKEVIEVVKEMIDNYCQLYEIPPDLHDDVIRLLMETNPEVADKILKQLANDVVIEPDPDTSSSVFDDSDSPSMPHSPSSDADLLCHSRGYMGVHQTLRSSKSADPCTPLAQRKPGIVIEERRTASSSDDRPKVRVNIEKTTSPLVSRSQRTSRTPMVKVSRDSSSPEVLLRPHVDIRGDRPYSEGYSHSLSIPKPSYLRENSSSSISSYLSSTNSPGGSDTSIQWSNQSPPSSSTSSPRPIRRSSSQRRPLNLNQGDDAPVGSAEWQRERWRHWEMIAADKKGEGYEQETLV